MVRLSDQSKRLNGWSAAGSAHLWLVSSILAALTRLSVASAGLMNVPIEDGSPLSPPSQPPCPDLPDLLFSLDFYSVLFVLAAVDLDWLPIDSRLMKD